MSHYNVQQQIFSLLLLHILSFPNDPHEEFESKVDDLDPAEDGEPGEETHGASN